MLTAPVNKWRGTEVAPPYLSPPQEAPVQAGRYEPAAAEKVAAGQHQMVFPPPPNGADPISGVPTLLQPQVVLEVALILS